jgi:hypothetical protein
MSKSSVYAEELTNACQREGCPVCRLLDKSVKRAMQALFYEFVNDYDTRQGLRQSRGLCDQHAWQAADQHAGSPLGYAIVYKDVIEAIMESLPPDAGPGSQQGWRGRIQKTTRTFSPTKPCPVCAQTQTTQTDILASLANELSNPAFVTALRASDGLCMPHFLAALHPLKESESFEGLLSIEREKLAALQLELAELIRKNDYRFSEEDWGAEGDSWRRAIQILYGSNKGSQE